MKNAVIFGLLAILTAQNASKPTIQITRQRSADPDYNGLVLDVELSPQDIKAKRFRLFLTRQDLKTAWRGQIKIQ